MQGPATLTVTHPPRDSEVEFTGGAGGARDRVVRLPMRGAIPVLSRALRADDAHPSVGLLGGATVLALKLVAAGRIRVCESGDAWQVGPLTGDDTDAVRRLAQARAFDGVDPAEAEARIRGLLDAVADTMTRTPARVQPQRRPVSHATSGADPPTTGSTDRTPLRSGSTPRRNDTHPAVPSAPGNTANRPSGRIRTPCCDAHTGTPSSSAIP